MALAMLAASAGHVGGGRRPAAEAASGDERVQLDLVGRQANHVRHRSLVEGLDLRARPDLAAVARELHHAVERLHGRVGEEGELVDRLEGSGRAGEGRGGIAVAPGREARLLGEGPELRQELVGAAPLGLALVPLHAEGRAPLARRPEALPEHRHSRRAPRPRR